MNPLLRALVPGSVRRRMSAGLAGIYAVRLERDLAALVRGGKTIVAGPWLGEVGFELLYWAPFLAWFVEHFRVDAERLLIVSRGGTAAWYRPFAARYRDIFDHISSDEFRRRHNERVALNGEQKQTQLLAFEHELLYRLTSDIRDRVMLHPSTMYRLFNPYWWSHVGEAWIHRHARFRRLERPARPAFVPRRSYVAVKFYFNDCFPATDANRTFVREVVRGLAERGPVVSLTTGLSLDDHRGDEGQLAGVHALPQHLEARDNLAVQDAIVAHASAFVGTYGGFSYLAPFHGVMSTAYYEDPAGFSHRHLAMARSAFAALGSAELFDVRPVSHTSSLQGIC